MGHYNSEWHDGELKQLYDAKLYVILDTFTGRIMRNGEGGRATMDLDMALKRCTQRCVAVKIDCIMPMNHPRDAELKIKHNIFD